MSLKERLRSLGTFSYISIFLVVLLFSWLLEYFFNLHFGDYLVAFGTMVLALVTWRLARTTQLEGIRERSLLRNENKKERRRLRLKEQLEGLYSPLMAHIEYIDSKDGHTTRGSTIFKIMIQIRSKYEFLAEPDLKEILREYYNTNLSALSDKEWEDLSNGFRDAIGIGHSDLIDENNELTQPVS